MLAVMSYLSLCTINSYDSLAQPLDINPSRITTQPQRIPKSVNQKS